MKTHDHLDAVNPASLSNPSGRPLRAGSLKIRRTNFEWGARTYLMGIVNVTPDSFSGDGETDEKEAIGKGFLHLVAGADIVDIGGESTRPGHTPVTAEIEISRVLPVIKGLREHSDAIISVDTSKAEALKLCANAGADILNLVGEPTPPLLEVVVEHNMAIVITHTQAGSSYEEDVVDKVLKDLYTGAHKAVSAGLAAERVILDPGIGFGKTAEHNLRILSNLKRFVGLGFPTLIGTSRKTFIGKVTKRAVEHRDSGTAATVALAIEQGIDIVRVHNVAAMCDVAKVADAIVRGWRPGGWERE